MSLYRRKTQVSSAPTAASVPSTTTTITSSQPDDVQSSSSILPTNQRSNNPPLSSSNSGVVSSRTLFSSGLLPSPASSSYFTVYQSLTTELDQNAYLNRLSGQYFNLSTLYPIQLRAIRALLCNTHTFVRVPTGGGKSLCFQLTGLILQKTVFIITPLTALSYDQCLSLRKRGFTAISLSDETVSGTELLQAEQGAIQYVFCTPEKLLASWLPSLSRLYQSGRLGLLVVDEAHCIIQWGNDFRPEFIHLYQLHRTCPNIPLLALTATVTPLDAQNIMALLLDKQVQNQQQLQQQQSQQSQTLFLLESSKRSNITYLSHVRAANQDTGPILQYFSILFTQLHRSQACLGRLVSSTFICPIMEYQYMYITRFSLWFLALIAFCISFQTDFVFNPSLLSTLTDTQSAHSDLNSHQQHDQHKQTVYHALHRSYPEYTPPTCRVCIQTGSHLVYASTIAICEALSHTLSQQTYKTWKLTTRSTFPTIAAKCSLKLDVAQHLYHHSVQSATENRHQHAVPQSTSASQRTLWQIFARLPFFAHPQDYPSYFSQRAIAPCDLKYLDFFLRQDILSTLEIIPSIISYEQFVTILSSYDNTVSVPKPINAEQVISIDSSEKCATASDRNAFPTHSLLPITSGKRRRIEDDDYDDDNHNGDQNSLREVHKSRWLKPIMANSSIKCHDDLPVQLDQSDNTIEIDNQDTSVLQLQNKNETNQSDTMILQPTNWQMKPTSESNMSDIISTPNNPNSTLEQNDSQSGDDFSSEHYHNLTAKISTPQDDDFDVDALLEDFFDSDISPQNNNISSVPLADHLEQTTDVTPRTSMDTNPIISSMSLSTPNSTPDDQLLFFQQPSSSLSSTLSSSIPHSCSSSTISIGSSDSASIPLINDDNFPASKHRHIDIISPHTGVSTETPLCQDPIPSSQSSFSTIVLSDDDDEDQEGYSYCDLPTEIGIAIVVSPSLGYYHGKMTYAARELVHKQFIRQEFDVLIATCAFGMGIDVPFVQSVCHWGMPQSFNAYHQESGRGGRNPSKIALSVIFYHPSAYQMIRQLLLHKKNDNEVNRTLRDATILKLVFENNTTVCKNAILQEIFDSTSQLLLPSSFQSFSPVSNGAVTYEHIQERLYSQKCNQIYNATCENQSQLDNHNVYVHISNLPNDMLQPHLVCNACDVCLFHVEKYTHSFRQFLQRKINQQHFQPQQSSSAPTQHVTLLSTILSNHTQSSETADIPSWLPAATPPSAPSSIASFIQPSSHLTLISSSKSFICPTVSSWNTQSQRYFFSNIAYLVPNDTLTYYSKRKQSTTTLSLPNTVQSIDDVLSTGLLHVTKPLFVLLTFVSVFSRGRTALVEALLGKTTKNTQLFRSSQNPFICAFFGYAKTVSSASRYLSSSFWISLLQWAHNAQFLSTQLITNQYASLASMKFEVYTCTLQAKEFLSTIRDNYFSHDFDAQPQSLLEQWNQCQIDPYDAVFATQMVSPSAPWPEARDFFLDSANQMINASAHEKLAAVRNRLDDCDGNDIDNVSVNDKANPSSNDQSTTEKTTIHTVNATWINRLKGKTGSSLVTSGAKPGPAPASLSSSSLSPAKTIVSARTTTSKSIAVDATSQDVLKSPLELSTDVFTVLHDTWATHCSNHTNGQEQLANPTQSGQDVSLLRASLVKLIDSNTISKYLHVRAYIPAILSVMSSCQVLVLFLQACNQTNDLLFKMMNHLVLTDNAFSAYVYEPFQTFSIANIMLQGRFLEQQGLYFENRKQLSIFNLSTSDQQLVDSYHDAKPIVLVEPAQIQLPPVLAPSSTTAPPSDIDDSSVEFSHLEEYDYAFDFISDFASYRQISISTAYHNLFLLFSSPAWLIKSPTANNDDINRDNAVLRVVHDIPLVHPIFVCFFHQQQQLQQQNQTRSIVSPSHSLSPQDQNVESSCAIVRWNELCELLYQSMVDHFHINIYTAEYTPVQPSNNSHIAGGSSHLPIIVNGVAVGSTLNHSTINPTTPSLQMQPLITPQTQSGKGSLRKKAAAAAAAAGSQLPAKSISGNNLTHILGRNPSMSGLLNKNIPTQEHQPTTTVHNNSTKTCFDKRYALLNILEQKHLSSGYFTYVEDHIAQDIQKLPSLTPQQSLAFNITDIVPPSTPVIKIIALLAILGYNKHQIQDFFANCIRKPFASPGQRIFAALCPHKNVSKHYQQPYMNYFTSITFCYIYCDSIIRALEE